MYFTYTPDLNAIDYRSNNKKKITFFFFLKSKILLSWPLAANDPKIESANYTIMLDMSTNIHKNWRYGSKEFDSFTDRKTIFVEKSVVFYLKIKNIDLKFFL